MRRGDQAGWLLLWITGVPILIAVVLVLLAVALTFLFSPRPAHGRWDGMLAPGFAWTAGQAPGSRMP